MEKAPPIKDYMISHPVTIDLYETASAAEKIMRSKNIHHLPVVDGKKIYGIIADRDIASARKAYPSGTFEGKVLVRDICLDEPYLVKETESLESVAHIMSKKRIDAVIITRQEVPVGIFTAMDACTFIARLYKKESTGYWF